MFMSTDGSKYWFKDKLLVSFSVSSMFLSSKTNPRWVLMHTVTELIIQIRDVPKQKLCLRTVSLCTGMFRH